MIKVNFKKIIVTVVTLHLFLFSNAQELVLNGDFETYSCLPNNTGDWNCVTGWTNVNNKPPSGVPLVASSDYYHNLGTGDAQSPNTSNGDALPYSGDAMMGIWCNHAFEPDVREYIDVNLVSPMVIGETYIISFWITNGYANHSYGNSTNHFGVQLSVGPLNQFQAEVIGGTPQVEVTTEIWALGWERYAFNYTATNAFDHVTIGNFYNDLSTSNTIRVTGAGVIPASYYFIDDVSIAVGICPATVDIIKDTIVVYEGDSALINTVYSSNGIVTWSPSTFLNDSATQNPLITPTESGWYFVNFRDTSGCIAIDSVYILFESCPTSVDIIKDTIILDIGDSALINTVYSSNGVISWSPSTFLNDSTAKTPLITPTESGWYFVNFNDTLSCTAIDSVYILIKPCAVNILMDTSLVLKGDEVMIEVVYSDASTNIIWFPFTGIDNVNDSEPTITPIESMYYYVEFIDLNGCLSSDSIFLQIISCNLSVPTAFTPDGDGNNDLWNLTCLDEQLDAILKVYNRWGGLVYESKGGAEYSPWNGSNNGKELPVGTYYYTIEGLSFESELSNGIVTIIK